VGAAFSRGDVHPVERPVLPAPRRRAPPRWLRSPRGRTGVTVPDTSFAWYGRFPRSPRAAIERIGGRFEGDLARPSPGRRWGRPGFGPVLDPRRRLAGREGPAHRPPGEGL